MVSERISTFTGGPSENTQVAFLLLPHAAVPVNCPEFRENAEEVERVPSQSCQETHQRA